METNNVDSNAVNSDNVITERRRLYMAALKGDWKSIEEMPCIQRRLSKRSAWETTLHIAAAANKEDFVKNLFSWMEKHPTTLEAESVIGSTVRAENVIGSTVRAENVVGTTPTAEADDEIGNSALTLAATVGNVNIAEEIIQKLNIADRMPMKPLFMASFSGHSQMVQFLYPKTNLVGNEKADIFINCVKSDLYGEALQMLNDNPDLAGARNNIKTALRVLAHKPSAFVTASQPGMLRKRINILFPGLKKEKSKQFEANVLLEKCLQAYKSDVGRFIDIPDVSEVLFDAAKVGNIEFLIKLIHFDFNLLWKWTRDEDKTIFHLAVEERHESIFSLLHELGSVGVIIVSRTNKKFENILHLAAKMAPQEKLNAISGAALQMRREILWFKEVEKFVNPDCKVKKDEGDTPYALFVRNHEELRKEGEKWMIGTANYSMVVATIIGTIMFSGQVADGLNQNPHIFLAYTVSTAISLFGSSTSLIMFLSILTSRYSYDDFLVWLPFRLMIGVTSLYISIVAMMVAFATSFWLKNYNRDAKYVVIVLCAFVPSIDVLLKYRLVFDVVHSILFRFRPRHRLLHEGVSYAPVSRPQSPEPANLDNVSIQHPQHNDGE